MARSRTYDPGPLRWPLETTEGRKTATEKRIEGGRLIVVTDDGRRWIAPAHGLTHEPAD